MLTHKIFTCNFNLFFHYGLIWVQTLPGTRHENEVKLYSNDQDTKSIISFIESSLKYLLYMNDDSSMLRCEVKRRIYASAGARKQVYRSLWFKYW